ncbi:hypothetical protein AAFC00_000288 [Neodothiora populina]|uniref:Uncharacterized protein n=1 Tax=Neodothiora populina TaxID=2781224 RepID=A0ABR3PCL4_9PEZI
MSSDDAYASFLEKANQDTSSSTTQQAKKDTGFAQTKSVDTDVPAQLKSVTGESSELFYMSETDEPFEAVALGFEKGAELSVDAFAKLIGTKSSDIEESSLSSWNVKGAYNDVVDAVKKAVGGGEVGIKVFRVAHESTRCEYFVVGVNSQGAVVGVKAKAVET